MRKRQVKMSYHYITIEWIKWKRLTFLQHDYSPITSWEIDGETVETVSYFILGGSKITADGDYSHEIKRRLLNGHPLQYSCLENPMSGGAWWVAIYGVAQSWT